METVLYITKDTRSPSILGKLAGIQRFCSSRGWEAQLVNRQAFQTEELAGILRERRPVGCVIDGVANNVDLPPRLFRGVPVSYIGYMRGRTGNFPNFHFNTKAIAEAAFRELSASIPPFYAAVGNRLPNRWSRQRVQAFRDIALSAGAECRVFQRTDATPDGFVTHLAPWIAKLPVHCAVFAVSDTVAILVEQAARLVLRHIPRSLTLVSVDNFAELCENAEPPISSIQLDFERMGFLAARALGEKTAGREPILVDPLMVARRKSTSGSGRHEKFILDAVEIIRREACDGLTVRSLIDRFPQSRRNFERRFREAMGHSILDEILHVRLERVCTLLAQTDMPIGAIPDFCGFDCPRTLHALFQSRFHTSMRDWRKEKAR